MSEVIQRGTIAQNEEGDLGLVEATISELVDDTFETVMFMGIHLQDGHTHNIGDPWTSVEPIAVDYIHQPTKS